MSLLSALLMLSLAKPTHFVAAAEANPKGDRYALLVGVRQYSEAKELRPLPYAENDMSELSQVLRDGGYQPENVVLMTQAAGADELRFLPLKARILKELRLLLASRVEDDTVLLAFAGHGVVFRDDPDSYFCPADARLDDKDTLLSLKDVYRELERCKAGTKLLLVDACRNDPLTDRTRAPAKLDLESVTRPPEPAKDGGVAAFFSCSRGQKAYEDEKSKHGAFFHFVIEGLKGEASDGKDEVSLLELGAFVQRRVADFARSEYAAEQQPEMTNASAHGAAAVTATAGYVKAYRRGQKSLKQEEYGKAEAEFTEALRMNPKYAPALRDRGDAFYGLGDCDKAIADYDEAIRLDPRDADAFNDRGVAYGSKGDHDKAIADYGEAIRLNPGIADYYYDRGGDYFDKGDYDKAIADYNETIRLNPKYAAAFNDRGIAYYSKRDYARAKADYNEAIRLDPKAAAYVHNRGNNYYATGDFDKAIADYDEAIRLDPKFAQAYQDRGNAYTQLGNKDKADADYEMARSLGK